MKILSIIFLFVICCNNFIIAQNKRYLDSLELLLIKTKDTSRISILKKLAWEYKGVNLDKSNKYANEIISISEKFKLPKYKATALHYLCVIQIRTGNYKKALEFENKALKISEGINDSSGIAMSLSSIGNCYGYMGEINKANEVIRKSIYFAKKVGNLKVYANGLSNLSVNYIEVGEIDSALVLSLQALKIFEELKDITNICSSFLNIAALYSTLGKLDNAKEYLLKALEISKGLNDKSQLAIIFSNLSVVYFRQDDLNKAIEYSNIAMKLREEVKDISGLSESYNLLGIIFRRQENYSKAIENDLKALKIRKEIDDKYGIAETYYRLGISYRKIGELIKSIKYLNNSIEIAKEVGLKKQMQDSYVELAQTYFKKGDFRLAYVYHEKYTVLKDTIFSDNMQKQFVEMQTKYETEKKEDEILILNKDKQLKNAEILKQNIEVRKQRIVIYSFIIGFLIIVFFTIIIYRLYVQKKLANNILSQQKEEISSQRDEIESQRDLVTIQKEHIEEMHNEVTASINYAKKIQEAILPISDSARYILGEHFILFKPKDIVSGDFYFTTKINNWLIVAVADCTGHGVPGAFMSMLGISFLNEIIRKKEITQTNQVLNELRKEIIHALQQKGVSGEQKDGMDISLIALNIETYKCQFSGANNPLYIVRNDKLIEYKGDKMPIAIYPVMKEFENIEINLNKGDSVYLFTDGYADQFGGPYGRKFMYKQLKEILIQNHTKPMTMQKEILESAFENWKGNNEQIDDVTILGLKI